jgi:hypothetical protein
VVTRRHIAQTLFLAPWLLLAACQRNVKGLPKEIVMQKYPMKTYSVGRFQIDAPEAAKYTGIGGVRYNGFEIGRSKNQTVDLAGLVRAKTAEFSSTDPKKNKFIESYLSDDKRQAVILSTDTPGYNAGGQSLGYCLIGGNGQLYEVNSIFSEEGKQQAILLTKDVMTLLKVVNDVSSLKGFLAEGFVIGAADPVGHEQATIGFEMGDIAISFRTHVRKPSTEPGLIDRVPKKLASATEIAKTTEILRLTKRAIGTYEGEEVVFKNLKGSDGLTTHEFQWQSRGLNQLAAPEMELNMRFKGDPDKPAVMSDEEALGLWDAILNSIHLRSGAL